MPSDKPHLELCNLSMNQYPQIKEVMDEAYTELGGAWPEHTIQRLIEQFPEGQIGVIEGDRLVGLALSVQVNYRRFSNPHTYENIVGANDVISSDPDGDALYGLDMVIRKSHRGMRIGRRLYDARKEL